MPAKTKKKSTPIRLPTGTTTSPLPTGIAAVGTEAPATTTDPVPQTTPPPTVNIPVPPTGFAAVNARDYVGAYPKAGQVAAAPAVILELDGNTSFVETFEPLVPEVSHLAADLTNASGWTTLRQALETYLVYVKSQEAISWKQAKSDLEALNVVFQGVAAHNPALLDELPALARLLDVQKQIAQRAVATRAAKAKAKVAKVAATAGSSPAAGPAAAAPATAAAAAPVVSPSTVASGSGGATH